MSIAKAQVGYDIFKLQDTISNLWKARMNPATADEVLASEADLWSAAGSLRALLEDVRAANDERPVNLAHMLTAAE